MRPIQSSPTWWRRIALVALSLLYLAVTACTQNLQLDLSNGISVSDPKVFDNRSLSIMLEQLSQQLASVQTINGTTINGALANQQGAASHTQSLSVSLAASAIPGAAAAADKANPQPPSPPGAATLPTAPTFAPTFGASASDLLSDQVDLSYQIFNIRMLLERALSDRLYKGNTRLQAVVGFQVSIDPPEQATDQAAFVEVTVTSTDSRKPPSLVALMPFEKTYNSSTLSSSAVGVGAAAVFQIFSLGVNAQKQDQVFYLLRDTDTMAMEVMQPHNKAQDGSITFGWQFRPVLGRHSVSPGVRQMFAVLAMPDSDEGSKQADFNVQVHTFWRNYNRDHLTTSSTENYERDSRPVTMTINSSSSYEHDLAPVIDNFQWVTAGANTAVVSFTGKNFFPGTQIQVGDKTHSGPSTGLLIKSDISMELTTPLQDLAAGEAFISGRYGKGITAPRAKDDCRASGILINKLNVTSLSADENRLDLTLQERDGADLDLTRCTGNRPLVSFGGNVLPDPYVQPVTCKAIQLEGLPQNRQCYYLFTFFKSNLISGSTLAAVRYPFRGPRWGSTVAYVPFPYTVTRQRTVKVGKATNTILQVMGDTFDRDWQVVLDKHYEVTKTGALQLDPVTKALYLTVDTTMLSSFKQLTVVPPASTGLQPTPATIPSATTPPAKPTLDASKPVPPVVRGTAPAITVTGAALTAVSRVTFASEDLTFQKADDGSTLTIILTRNVTRKAGTAVLLLRPVTGDFITVPVTVTP